MRRAGKIYRSKHRSNIRQEVISNLVEAPNYRLCRCIAAAQTIVGFYSYLTGFDMSVGFCKLTVDSRKLRPELLLIRC